MRALRKPGVLLGALLILLVGAAFLTQVVPYRQILESNQNVESARTELAAYEEDNERLQRDIEALHSDFEVEKLAREKLGYVWPGEQAFVVVDPPGSAAPAPSPAPAPEPEQTWVDRIWDFLTGADQVE